MKCLEESCPGTAIDGNYCKLHKKRIGKPRPGVAGLYLYEFKRRGASTKIIGYATRAELKLGSRVSVKVWIADGAIEKPAGYKSGNARIFKVKKNQLNETLRELELEGVKRYLWSGQKR